jgi:F-type H+-transporting ATPase subunit b
MGIAIDATFAIQIVSFLILWAVLKRLLFDPMLGVLEQRAQRTEGSRLAASHMHADVEAMRNDYDDRVRAAREKSLAALEESRKLTAAEERTILGAARDQAAAHIALARVEIGRQIDAARAALRADTDQLARQLVEKVVGRPLA